MGRVCAPLSRKPGTRWIRTHSRAISSTCSRRFIRSPSRASPCTELNLLFSMLLFLFESDHWLLCLGLLKFYAMSADQRLIPSVTATRPGTHFSLQSCQVRSRHSAHANPSTQHPLLACPSCCSMHCSAASSLLPLLHCQPPRAVTMFASSLQLSFMSRAVQRQCSVSLHSSPLALPMTGIAWPLLLSSRCMRRQANFRCCSLLSSVTCCLAARSLLLSCTSLAVRCMQLSSLQLYCDALALHCSCCCASTR
jgi:hypothetical protein